MARDYEYIDEWDNVWSRYNDYTRDNDILLLLLTNKSFYNNVDNINNKMEWTMDIIIDNSYRKDYKPPPQWCSDSKVFKLLSYLIL